MLHLSIEKRRQIAYYLLMIIEIKEGNRQFTVSAELLFGLRKEETMNGYTRDLLQAELDATEEETLRSFVDENPANEYWSNRLAAFLNRKEQQRQAAEIAADMEILDGWQDDKEQTTIERLERAWQIEAEAQAADAADLQRTQDDARM